MKESANKIRNAFRKFNQPRVKYLNLDKAMTAVEINVEHLKKEEKDINTFIGSIKQKIISSARKLLIVKTNIKLGLGVNATFQTTDTEKTEVTNTISTKHQTVYSSSQIDRVVDSLIEDLLNRFEHINHKGSGYTVKKINHVFLKSYKVKPIRGTSYIPTPEKFANSRCGLVNIKNEDQECFKW
jgi:predicted  nucleic acid-binding Zn-ribbon protein